MKNRLLSQQYLCWFTPNEFLPTIFRSEAVDGHRWPSDAISETSRETYDLLGNGSLCNVSNAHNILHWEYQHAELFICDSLIAQLIAIQYSHRFHYLYIACIPPETAFTLGETSKFQRCGHQLAAEVGNKW